MIETYNRFHRDPIDITTIGDRGREYLLPDGRIVRERCDYCQRPRANLIDNCAGCGAPP